MASRSFKPSYFTSAAQGSSWSPSQRPSFSRTNSSSSNVSTKSDDSLVQILMGLTTEDRPSGEEMDAFRSAVNGTSIHPTTPGRKRSQPIAIELPSRNPEAYTPLSARGDLIGGYFPDHEDPMLATKIYQPHPFHHSTFTISSASPDSPTMSASSSPHPSPTTTVPKMSGGVSYTPIGSVPGPFSLTMPETLLIPMGKYHPANYKCPASTSISTPTSAPRASFLPPTNLTMPPKSTKRGGKSRPGHERKTSDVKRKLQQYQRDMIVQAQLLASTSTGQQLKSRVEPISPRLLPAGSPGPITPFELEGDFDSYILAGHRARGVSQVGDELQHEKEIHRSQPITMTGSERPSGARI